MSQPEDQDGDEPIELDELEGTPFTYFYLSSQESMQAMNAEAEGDDVILMEETSPPINTKKDLEEEEGFLKQATTHISVLPDVALASQGEQRQKWLATRKKENRQPDSAKGYHRSVTSRKDCSQGEGST